MKVKCMHLFSMEVPFLKQCKLLYTISLRAIFASFLAILLDLFLVTFALVLSLDTFSFTPNIFTNTCWSIWIQACTFRTEGCVHIVSTTITSVPATGFIVIIIIAIVVTKPLR